MIFLKKWKRYVGLYDVLEKVNPDILFIHNVSFADVDTIVKYLRKHIIDRVYVDNHSDFSNSGTSWLSKNVLHKIIWKKNAQRLNPYTKKFYGVTPARVDWLVDMYGLPKAKCELLVMGGDDEKVFAARDKRKKIELRYKYNISETDFLIITGGKIDEEKAQTLFLMKAVKNINNENVKLIVFGSVADGLKEKVSELADGKSIQYIGWIESQESYSYFAMSDLVVFPGRHSVYWEQCVAIGVPMICKFWKGTDHINVNGNVAFLKSDCVEEIQEKILYHIQNREFYNNQLMLSEKASENFMYSQIAIQSII